VGVIDGNLDGDVVGLDVAGMIWIVGAVVG